jgi:predicted TIM-barrel fold metal-dependent hydrolase
MSDQPLIFDSWINLPYAAGEVAPDPNVTKWFKRSDSSYEGGETLEDVIGEMDRFNITGGVLTKVPRDITPPYVAGIRGADEDFHKACHQLAEAMAAWPGRFVAAVGMDPRLGYAAAKQARIAHQEYGITTVRVIPMFTGIPINDPVAYPLYTALCDLGMTVTFNVGVPGPLKPAKLQRTILVDDVALCFPELKIVMSHVGDPWIPETISMLNKHPNVFLQTAGWAPKYVPKEILTFMGARGPTKVMWASDYPILPIDRTITEGLALDIRERARPGYLGANALAVFGEPVGFNPDANKTTAAAAGE